ncbi:MAG: hypothetical protein JWM55_69 [Acidimicrobiaceae bacterium]|nr:hypothetical protein [Acidimicrobiaceae bacterium]
MKAKDLLSRVSDNLSVGRSFGSAYEKDGLYVIPVAFVAGGCGGGEGPTGTSSSDTDDDDTVEESPHGSGAGFGGVVFPVGAYVVKDDDVRWVPAINVTLLALVGLGVFRFLVKSSMKARTHRRG